MPALSANSCISLILYVLPNESIGNLWGYCLNFPPFCTARSLPTRRVGESSLRNWGYSSSRPCSSFISISYS